MKRYIVTLSQFLILFQISSAQVKTITSDKDWDKTEAYIKDAYEAEHIIRIGDVDNLGFGWPDDFDPFCGRMTQAHTYPWNAPENDLPFMDRIMVSSKFSGEGSCGNDGYSYASGQITKGPAVYQLPTTKIKGVSVQNAWIQLFIDDFQAPSFCSKYRFLINDKIFAEGEKIINAIDQTGPVGKLVSIQLPEEYFNALSDGKLLVIKIDEISGAGDGYAIDFIRLLINRKRENSCKGSITGWVKDAESEQAIVGATITTSENLIQKSGMDGKFEFKDIPIGFEVLTASAAGYIDGRSTADIGEGNENNEVYIYLKKGKEAVNFGNKTLKAGESITLNNILFDQGKSTLRSESFIALDKLVALMKSNDKMEIELSGHTSSEGDIKLNRSLSYQRVVACKQYLLTKGIDGGRILTVGFGPDKPVAPNDNESNRAKNRRVEMRIMAL